MNASQNLVAFSDRQLNPRIYVYNFPGLKKIAKLKGGYEDTFIYSIIPYTYGSIQLNKKPTFIFLFLGGMGEECRHVCQ